MSQSIRWIVGISGASGTVYARRLLRVIAEEHPGIAVELVITDGATRVFKEEDGLEYSSRSDAIEKLIGVRAPNITVHNNRDTGCSIASGSYQTEGMIVIPCSMNSLAAIAHGISDTLLRRAADVTIKEGRRLILVPRETPLSLIHLRNLTSLCEMGVKIVPAMPGFYTKPESVEDLVDHMVLRFLDQMGISSTISKRWGAEKDRANREQ